MVFHYSKRKVNIVLITVFLINVIFLPNDTFQLKKLSFLLLMVYNASLFFNVKTKDERFFFFFGFTYVVITILQSWLVMGGDLMGNIREGFSGFMFLIYFVIKKYKINYEKIFITILMIMAYFMVFMALLDFTHILPTKSNKLLMWFHYSDNAMIGRGSNHAFGIIYFMKTSPLLLIALPYQIKNNKTLNAFVVLGALFLSATRANILLAVVVFFSSYIYKDQNKNRRMFLIFLEVLAVLYVLLGTGVVQKMLDVFTMKADGDRVRFLTMKSIIDVWKADPLKFVTGSGYSSTFFSEGRGQVLNTVELSYWSQLRRVGIIAFLILMYMYIKPFKMLKKETIICFGYLAFLIMAYVDPVLCSSTGISAVLYMYYLMNLKDRDKKIVNAIAETLQIKKRSALPRLSFSHHS